MTNDGLVRGIVETYDLSPKLEERIVWIASERIDELSIHGFDEVYRYISGLIEKFQMHYAERLALRLDKPIETRFGEIYPSIGVEDRDLSSLFEGQEPKEIPERISINEAISILERRMDEHSCELMRQLLHQGSSGGYLPLNISPEEIIENLPAIQLRLEELAYQYEKDGKIVTPPRPIIAVRFDPLAIRFGRRRYNGNPLAFFRAHPDVYEGRSRTEFERFDGGLCTSLRKYRQIDEAIPISDGWRLPQAKKEGIVAAYKTYEGNASEASRHMTHSIQTILRCWEDAGLDIMQQGHPLEEAQIAEIVAAHPTYKGNASEASRHLPYHMDTISKYWKVAGLTKK